MVNGERLIDILGFCGGIPPFGRLKRRLDQFRDAAKSDLSTDK
jgi:hypothetical protein